MTAVDTALADELLASHLDIMRLEVGLRARVIDILDRLQRELLVKLTVPDALTDWNKARTQALLKQIREVTDNYYMRAQGELDLTLRVVPEVVSTHVADALGAHVAIGLDAALPTTTFMARLAANSLIQGGPMAEWWEKLATDTAFKLANAIRQGMAAGETNADIIYRVIGKGGEPGIMDIARRNAAAVVQTATMTVANDARLQTFAKNADVIKALQWLTALDDHVCPLCAARADLTWTNDAAHEPIGHDLPWEHPPIHFNDRCLMSPITKTYRELGLSLDEVPPGQRASMDGPVDARTTFAEWFARRTPAQQDEQFGAARAQLYRDGKLTLRQMTDMSGNPLTVKELQAKYG
jgi:Phage Mu protein F like protein